MESLVLVPIGAAFYQVCQKVSALRQEVADRDVKIEALEIAAAQTQEYGPVAPPSGGGGAGRAAIIAGVAISGAAALYQGGRLIYNIRQNNSSTTGSTDSTTPGGAEGDVLVQSAPPAGYQPQKAGSDQEACIVCLHNVKDTLVMPCSHMALCWVCAETLAAGSSSAGAGPSPQDLETAGGGGPSPPPGGGADSMNNNAGSANSRNEVGGDAPQPRRVIRRQQPADGSNAASPGRMPPPLCPVCRGDIQSLTFAYVA